MNLLVGYDDSVESKIALSLAQRHAKAYKANLIVIQCIATMVPKNILKKIKQDLEEILRTVKKYGVTCETHLLINDKSLGENIIRFSEENSINQIIIGYMETEKHGHKTISTTINYIIMNAKCPIIIAR